MFRKTTRLVTYWKELGHPEVMLSKPTQLCSLNSEGAMSKPLALPVVPIVLHPTRSSVVWAVGSALAEEVNAC